MTTLFISDLHLCAERPAITELFLDFLRREAMQADALYILGDLFEHWIGDDATSQEEYYLMLEGMRNVASADTPLLVMHGNRDFLMGTGFEHATGCRLLKDPTVIDLYGTRVLLMHGDTLCTDDQAYQAFRRKVRSPEFIREFLGKSTHERNSIVREIRETSRIETAKKHPEIMDVNQQTVKAAMRQHDVAHLIHGHTHRPAQHIFELDGKQARRTVLGDWYDQGSVLRCTPTDWQLEPLPLGWVGQSANAAPVQ
ncbi:MAG: UDP-2,3-diacylglucosamine diphosphatase [Acidiferrobacterales bacterium]